MPSSTRAAPRAASAWPSERGGLRRPPDQARERIHTAVIGRIVRSVDFERVLRCPPRARTAHFALHHLRGCPTPPSKAASNRGSDELSTGEVPLAVAPVDDSELRGSASGPTQWLGMVIPKRHARRAVTRTLLKRQIRALAQSHAAGWPAGLWVVRLRAPWDRQTFPSATSPALASVAAEELSALMSASPTDRPKRQRAP